jgi:hypothetical protein
MGSMIIALTIPVAVFQDITFHKL